MDLSSSRPLDGYAFPIEVDNFSGVTQLWSQYFGSVVPLAMFLSDPGVPGPMYGSSCLSLYLCANVTDVTLADEDTNSILTDNAKRAFQGNVAMRVTQPGVKICN